MLLAVEDLSYVVGVGGFDVLSKKIKKNSRGKLKRYEAHYEAQNSLHFVPSNVHQGLSGAYRTH